MTSLVLVSRIMYVSPFQGQHTTSRGAVVGLVDLLVKSYRGGGQFGESVSD